MSLWLAGLAVISASLVSCDPVSSVDYKLYNKTSDTVTVAMYKEILTSSYGGFAVVESDSVTTYYGEADSVNVAVLAPDQVLWVHDEWNWLCLSGNILKRSRQATGNGHPTHGTASPSGIWKPRAARDSRESPAITFSRCVTNNHQTHSRERLQYLLQNQ